MQHQGKPRLLSLESLLAEEAVNRPRPSARVTSDRIKLSVTLSLNDLLSRDACVQLCLSELIPAPKKAPALSDRHVSLSELLFPATPQVCSTPVFSLEQELFGQRN